ncbi:glycosyltransferase family 2 protein [Petrachloros mirabilis]
MMWLDDFYSSSVAIPLSLFLLAVIGLLSWRGKGRQVIMVLTIFLYARYLLWRGVYTLNTADMPSLLISWTLLLAETYSLLHLTFFTCQAWNPLERESPPIKKFRTVDIFVTVVNEPLAILQRTLVGCTNQDYPKEKYRVYVLDDGGRDDVRTLARSLDCEYLRRQDRSRAKAGNLNHALQHTSGELIATFDTDHVPTSTFLRDTVGFFEDDRVALVQTPQHFYNEDVFQKNLRLATQLNDEQALFFRVLLPGRESRNSAFFCGTNAILRRKPLLEIGGFQTDTVTEDMHTSIMLHAKGYQSRYLNKVRAVGLEPETFAAYLRQRTRWAIGCMQIALKSNPLTVRGLTLAQRIDYFGSLWHFLQSVPRVVCLAAPLSALLLSIAPTLATVFNLVHFFGAYYLASLIMIRTVSRGTRNAIWSDVYETATCFTLSKATLSTLLRPFKPQVFAITPKGERLEKRGPDEAVVVAPHTILFGLLVGGLVVGIPKWMSNQAMPGLEVSIFWATFNLMLLSLAILSANEQPQWRNNFRLRRRVPCTLSFGSTRIHGFTKNMNEDGVCVQLNEPLQAAPQLVTLHLGDRRGANISVRGMVTRQEPSGTVFDVGVKIVDVGEAGIRAIIEEMFAEINNRTDEEEINPGIWKSLGTLVLAFRSPWLSRRPSRRFSSRLSSEVACEIDFGGRIFSGRTQNISFGGLAVLVDEDVPYMGGRGLIFIQGSVLKVALIGSARYDNRAILHFRIDSIEKGEERWQELNQSGSHSPS